MKDSCHAESGLPITDKDSTTLIQEGYGIKAMLFDKKHVAILKQTYYDLINKGFTVVVTLTPRETIWYKETP